MTGLAKNSKGAQWFMGTVADTLTQMGELLDITEPGFESELQNATTHDSGDAEEYIAEGTYNNTPMVIEGHYIAGSAEDVLILAAVTAVGPSKKRFFKTRPKAATGTYDRTFAGFVTNYTFQAKPVKGKQMYQVTVQPTGVVTQGATA